MLKKLLKIEKMALARGFYPSRGYWVKDFPSGNQWSFAFDGSLPVIRDKHGRIIHNVWHGITYIGMFHDLKK